jgi:hypothetical protein
MYAYSQGQDEQNLNKNACNSPYDWTLYIYVVVIFKYISLLCLNIALETVKLLYLKQPFRTVCWKEKWTEIRSERYRRRYSHQMLDTFEFLIRLNFYVFYLHTHKCSVDICSVVCLYASICNYWKVLGNGPRSLQCVRDEQ